MRLAYLVSRYPLPTHAFIRREIEALRALGADIHTFGIHRATSGSHPDPSAMEALRTTYTVRPVRWRAFIGAHAQAAIRHPAAYLQTLMLAFRLPPGARGRLTQIAYFGEAVPIWSECRKRDIRHLHAHFASPPADVAMFAAYLGRRAGGLQTWSFTGHGTDMFDDVRDHLAAKIRRASAVITVSEFGRANLMRLVEDEHWPRIRVIRCGLESRWFTPPPPVPRESRNSPLRMLTVGRLVPDKGHMVLLSAIADLERRGVPVVTEIVGGGARLPDLMRRAEELGIRHRVKFSGELGQDAIQHRYATADVFCLPSLGEGLPVSLMEAMASELPVIASRIAGIPELVDHEVSGVLVPPGRPEAIAAAIERLAAAPCLRREMGRAGRRKVVTDFRVDRSAERLWHVFSEILGQGQNGRPPVGVPAHSYPFGGQSTGRSGWTRPMAREFRRDEFVNWFEPPGGPRHSK